MILWTGTEDLPRDLDGRPVITDWRPLWEGIAAAIVVLFCIWAAYQGGQTSVLDLAVDAFDREEQYRTLTSEVLDLSTEVLYVVRREDIYLHERIRTEVPGWFEIAPIARAVVRVEP